MLEFLLRCAITSSSMRPKKEDSLDMNRQNIPVNPGGTSTPIPGKPLIVDLQVDPKKFIGLIESGIRVQTICIDAEFPIDPNNPAAGTALIDHIEMPGGSSLQIADASSTLSFSLFSGPAQLSVNLLQVKVTSQPRSYPRRFVRPRCPEAPLLHYTTPKLKRIGRSCKTQFLGGSCHVTQ